MFGDMGNALGLINMVIEVDLCNLFVAEEDVVDAFGDRWTDCDRKTIESFADFEMCPVEGDLAMIAHHADSILGCVGDGW